MKVAYDIAILGRYFNRYDHKTGLFRVIEEVMLELLKRDEIELTVAGIGDDKPMSDSIHSFFYTQHHKNCAQLKYSTSFKSHLGIDQVYKKILGIYLSREFQKLPKLSVPSVLVRGTLKILSYIQKLDTYHSFDYSKFDIFHSPHLKLPPQEVTGQIPRVLTIYDLIPVLAPQYATSAISQTCQGILQSINLEKDWIICISEYTKTEFCNYTGMSDERVSVAHLAAADHFYQIQDLDLISATCRYYGIPSSKYFLSLAALQPRKNFSHLIKSFCQFIANDPSMDIYLVIVGSKGWKYDSIFSTVSNYEQLRDRIIFTGYIPDEDLSAIYSGAQAFIFPSLYEGFGLPVLEAMQCGVPVIASNTTSIPEVVGDAGILIDPHDKEALCQAMSSLLSNQILRQQLKQKGLERAKQFSWAKCADETIKVYHKAINNK